MPFQPGIRMGLGISCQEAFWPKFLNLLFSKLQVYLLVVEENFVSDSVKNDGCLGIDERIQI